MQLLGLLVVFTLFVYLASLATLLRTTPSLAPRGESGRQAPSVSIIIPVRNEEQNVDACLRGALGQVYPDYEVIVVDDGSTDATPAILRRLASRERRLQVVQGGRLPSGWAGKCFAVHQGAIRSRGAWLLFLDADVTLEPGALAAAMAWANGHGVRLLSLWPRQELRTPVEKIVQSVVMAMYFFGEFYHRLQWPPGLSSGRANGQFLLAQAAAYRSVGGHEAIRGSVIEDHHLELAFRNAGLATATIVGTQVARIRMYATVGEIWQGWSKNTFAAMRYGVLESLGAAAVVGLVCIGPAVLALAAIGELQGTTGWTSTQILAVTSWVLLGLVRWRLLDLVPTPWAYLPTMPIGGFVVLGILANSALRHTVGGGVHWKGRTYDRDRQRDRSG